MVHRSRIIFLIKVPLFICFFMGGIGLIFLQAKGQNLPHLHSLTLTSDLLLPSAQKTEKGIILPKKSSSVVRSLWMIRNDEEHNRPESCLKNIAFVKAKAPALRSWLSISELSCTMGWVSRFQNLLPRLLELLNQLDQKSEWFLQGPQVKGLRQTYTQALFFILDRELKSNRRQAWLIIDRILQKKNWLNDEQLATVYRMAGDLAFIQQNFNLSLEYYGRSLKVQPVKDLEKKMDSVKKVLLKNKKKDSLQTTTDKTQDRVDSPASVPKTQNEPELEVSEEENRLYERIKSSLSSGDLFAAIEDIIKLIQNYPGGRRSDWASDRVIDVLNGINASAQNKNRILKERIMGLLAKADPVRQADWSRNFFSRAEYGDSLKLAELSMTQMTGKNLSLPLSIAAQSSVFLGDYKKAKPFFSRLIDEFGGTDLAVESLFRLGLLHLREEKYPSAVAIFERVLVLPQGKKYELQSRYWLLRALQKMNSGRVQQESQILVDKFPLSFYGLRIQAENHQGQLSLGTDSGGTVKVEVWLTESENQAWERFQLLLQAGWFQEAQAELDLLPTPQSPEEKVVWARIHGLAGDHSNAITLMASAWDEDRRLIRPVLYGLSFPDEYNSMIQKNAEKQNISAALIAGLIKQESLFQVDAVSPAHAAGLMQLMSVTAQDSAQYLNYKKKLNFPNDLFDPEVNLLFGTSYLKRMVRAFNGYLPLALGSYNLGIGRLKKWLSYRDNLVDLSQNKTSDVFDDLWIDELPWSETSFYVKAVLRNYLVYRLLAERSITIKNPWWMEVAP